MYLHIYIYVCVYVPEGLYALITFLFIVGPKYEELDIFIYVFIAPYRLLPSSKTFNFGITNP